MLAKHSSRCFLRLAGHVKLIFVACAKFSKYLCGLRQPGLGNRIGQPIQCPSMTLSKCAGRNLHGLPARLILTYCLSLLYRLLHISHSQCRLRRYRIVCSLRKIEGVRP